MTISVLQQTTEVTDVGQISATDIVETQDENGGTIYVREIRAYSAPADESSSQALLFTLRMVSPTKANLELNAPVQTF